jgi:hypothetical protein
MKIIPAIIKIIILGISGNASGLSCMLVIDNIIDDKGWKRIIIIIAKVSILWIINWSLSHQRRKAIEA